MDVAAAADPQGVLDVGGGPLISPNQASQPARELPTLTRTLRHLPISPSLPSHIASVAGPAEWLCMTSKAVKLPSIFAVEHVSGTPILDSECDEGSIAF